jgi:hypothetical protein
MLLSRLGKLANFIKIILILQIKYFNTNLQIHNNIIE